LKIFLKLSKDDHRKDYAKSIKKLTKNYKKSPINQFLKILHTTMPTTVLNLKKNYYYYYFHFSDITSVASSQEGPPINY
jgi:hypothetical protein